MNPVLIPANTTPGKRGFMPNLWWTPIYYQLFHLDWYSITKKTNRPLVYQFHVYGCSNGVIFVGRNFHTYRIVHGGLVWKNPYSSNYYTLNTNLKPYPDPKTGIWMCYDRDSKPTPVLLEPVTKAQLLMESVWT